MHSVLSWIQGITVKTINELGTGNIEAVIKTENNCLETVKDITMIKIKISHEQEG